MKTRILIHIVVRCCHKKNISCCCPGVFISVIKLEFALKDIDSSPTTPAPTSS